MYVNFSSHETDFVHKIFVRITCFLLIFVHQTYYMFVFLREMEFVACWFLFSELVDCRFLFAELVASWYFSFGNLYIDVSSHDIDFLHGAYCHLIFVRGACCLLIVFVVRETCCMSIFYFVKHVIGFSPHETDLVLGTSCKNQINARITYGFFTSWNIYFDFSLWENNFVYETCFMMIFVRGTCCMLVCSWSLFLIDFSLNKTCNVQNVKHVHWLFLRLAKRILFMELVADVFS